MVELAFENAPPALDDHVMLLAPPPKLPASVVEFTLQIVTEEPAFTVAGGYTLTTTASVAEQPA